jgi:NAD(P)-dependent dehydrogenase (short-subunit alcohol dehydrogenase family)
MRDALRHLVGRRHASIVTISSVNAFLADPAVIDYGAAKSTSMNVCQSLSNEFGTSGLRINSVGPGPVQTDLWLGEDAGAVTVVRQEHAPGGRRGTPPLTARPAGPITGQLRANRTASVASRSPGLDAVAPAIDAACEGR